MMLFFPPAGEFGRRAPFSFAVLASIAVLCLGTILAVSARAQPVAQGWGLAEALAAAMRNHPSIQGSQASHDAARAEREGARWQRYPSPSLEASAPNSGGSSAILRLDQPLWTWGRITAGIDAAGHREGAAGWAVNEVRRDIALRVVNAWTEVQRHQLRRLHAQEGVKGHEELLALMQRRVAREVSPKVDEDFARSRLLLALNDLAAVQQSLNAALSQLTQLVGARAIRAEGQLDDAQAPDSLETALDKASGHSPTLQRLQEEALAAGEDVRARRAAALPQVSFRVERNMGTQSGSSAGDNRALLVITAQPGAGFSYLSGVEAAASRQRAILKARDAARLEIMQQVNADWEELVSARARLRNAERAGEMASLVFESYMRQFAAGRKTWIDVLNAIREMTQTSFGIADARAQAAASSQRLRILSGDFDLGTMNRER